MSLYWYDFINLLVFAGEIFAALLLQIKKEKTRSHFPIRLSIAILLMIGQAFLFAWLDEITIFNNLFSEAYGFQPYWQLFNILYYTFQFATISFLFYLLFDIKRTKWIIACTVAYLLQHMNYQLNNIIYPYTGTHLVALAGDNWILSTILSNLFYIGLFVIVLVLMHFLFTKKISYSHFDFKMDKGLLAITFITLSVVIVFNTVRTCYEYESWHLSQMLCGFSLFSCLAILGVLRSYIIVKQETIKNTEEKRYFKNQIKAYEMAKENVELINIKCHDLRKQLRLLSKNEGKEEAEKIMEIQDSLRIYDNTFKTDCDALNTVLSSESLYIKEGGITLTVVANAEKLNDYDEVDIFSVFTNLMDNAINAVNKIEDKEKKLISLTIEEKAGFIHIDCRNYYVGSILFKGSNQLPSTSKDGKYHGYGTKSIVATMRKYGGKVRFYTEGEQFVASLVLPIKA